MLSALLSALFLASVAPTEKAYLFSYFSDNEFGGRKGEAAGLHLAYSYDGLSWMALNYDQPVLKPQVGKDRLMRDPSLCQGPDDTFHLVWTSGWSDRVIGYAASRDLVHWGEQRELPVMAEEPTARNCWAPELTYNPEDGLFYLYWSSTIPGRHAPIPEMDSHERGLNHRIYLTTTRDFKTFSPVRLWFNPPYSAIDATLVRDAADKSWLFFVKNENHTPVAKDIRVLRLKSLAEDLPSEEGEILTPHWTEGPSALFVEGALYLYFDSYRSKRFGALRSLDRGRTWKNVSSLLHMPKGIRHGTAIAVDRPIVDRLIRTRFLAGKEAPVAATNDAASISLSGLVMGAEKLLKYGERVKVEGVLTYLVSEGSDFRLMLDENGELKVVAVPGWWTPMRVGFVLATGFALLAAVLGWALLLRHQRKTEGRVNEAVRRERLRLSQDLHDGYQQLLAGCMFRLTAARTLLGKGNLPKAERQLDGLHNSLVHAQDELRAALWTMKEEADGPSAMADLFRYAASRLPQWEGRVTFESVGEVHLLSRQYAGALLMILQEAVGNALRHGHARHVRVKTVFGRRGLAMLVRDDGCGFDPASLPADTLGVHLGLEGMRARTVKLGGRFALRSAVGRGTTVKVVLEDGK